MLLDGIFIMVNI